MSQILKIILKEILPPFIIKLFKFLKKKKLTETTYGCFGNYNSWEEAEKNCSGYNDDVIINKCKNSLLKVKNGEAIYERDGVIFDKKEYSFPLLSSLLWIASINNNRINILDFGGSLGSTYYQNRDFFLHLEKFNWNIVEQQKFVDIGKKYFEDEHLKFYYSIEECVSSNKIDTVIFSSVLQYLPEPETILNKIFDYNIEYIIIDRTGFIDKEEKITIQIVPDFIYKASYPCRFFNEEKFLSKITNKYDLIYDFESFTDKSITIDNKIPTKYKGFFFKIKR